MTSSENTPKHEEGKKESLSSNPKIILSDQKEIYCKKTFCVVCKERIDRRFEIEIKDNKYDNTAKTHVCRDCFNTLMNNYNKESKFRLSRLLYKRKTKLSSFRFS